MSISSDQIVIVVGDRFQNFGDLKGIVTVSRLMRALDRDDGTGFGEGIHYVPGQGLTLEAIEQIRSKARRRQLGPWFRVWSTENEEGKEDMMRADRQVTHKHMAQNVLISEPRRLTEGLFEVDLNIDERNELLLDHSTGAHIQGMVLIEACRQTFLAVTERYFLRLYPDRSYYFVIRDFNTTFNTFAFPIETRIMYNLLEKDISNSSKLKFHAKMTVIQNDHAVVESSTQFVAFESELISRREMALADGCIREAQNRVIDRICSAKTMV